MAKQAEFVFLEDEEALDMAFHAFERVVGTLLVLSEIASFEDFVE